MKTTNTYSITDLMQYTNEGLDIFQHILQQYYPDLHIIMNKTRSLLLPNPFLENRKSLQIYWAGRTYMYRDCENETDEGNAVNFAARHYHTENYGSLQQLLADKLQLETVADLLDDYDEAEGLPYYEEHKAYKPLVSYYVAPISNTLPSKSLNLYEVYRELVFFYQHDYLQKIWNFKERAFRQRFADIHYPFISFGGEFLKRTEHLLMCDSGYMCLQFERLDDKQIVKNLLLDDDLLDVQLLFNTTLETGLNCIIRFDSHHTDFKTYFRGISNYLNDTYGLRPAPEGEDIGFPCTLSYDSEAWLHPIHWPKPKVNNY